MEANGFSTAVSKAKMIAAFGNKFRYEKNYSPMGDVYLHTMVPVKGKRIYSTNWIFQTPFFVLRFQLIPATW